MNRDHGPDMVKLFASWLALWFAINWNAVAAFLTCIFTLLLIIDKMGWLAPLKAAGARFWAKVCHKAPPV